MLPYLGPGIIAVVQAACGFASNDSRSGPRLTFPKSDDRIIPPVVLSSTLRCSNSRTVGVLQRFGPLAPLIHPQPDSAADLCPIGSLLAFIRVPSVRNGMRLPTYSFAKCVGPPARVRFQQFSLMWKFPRAFSGNTIIKPCHAD
jgi:hypothetical protein